MALDVARKMIGRIDGNTNFASYTFPVASGVTVTAGDFVYFASGRITSASVAGALCIGMVMETATGDSGGTVKALVCIDVTMRYLLQNDNIGTTFAASLVGTKFDLIGATGAQLVDTSTTGTTGQLVCLEYNPRIEPVQNDTTYGVFMLQENLLNTGTGGQ
jgi:hypothetical protein